jgi:hypothetical protein
MESLSKLQSFSSQKIQNKILKFVWMNNRSKTIKTVLGKKSIIIPDFKLYYRVIVAERRELA